MATTTGSTPQSYVHGQFARRIRYIRELRRWLVGGKVVGDLVSVRSTERRLAELLEGPLTAQRVLEIGPGQGRERARYLAAAGNDVWCLDLDQLPALRSPSTLVESTRRNGWRRTVKSAGRSLLVERASRRAWESALGRVLRDEPHALVGDICDAVPEPGAWDAVVSWSTFEHLPDPAAALRNVVRALRPGGVFAIELHLWTAANGHHDLVACFGEQHRIPAWAHLRPGFQHLARPSAYLNCWRLAAWRQLFAEVAPGAVEHLASVAVELSPAERADLAGYSDEELFTVTVQYVWRKPDLADQLASAWGAASDEARAGLTALGAR